jgi:probable DNA repair protein
MITTFDSASLESIADLAPEQTLVLTVNNRLARRILGELSASLNAARQVMAVPDIMPLSAWLRQAGDQLSFLSQAPMASRTIDAFGAQYLWQRVISDLESDHVLLDVAQAARLAADADRLLDDWRVNVPPDYHTADYERFRNWRRAYRDLLSEMDMEDANLAYERVLHAFEAGMLVVPFRTLALAGFNELSPRFSALVEALRAQGVRVLNLVSEHTQATQRRRIMASDPDDEWRQAAQWAARQLRQKPDGRYAIVAAQLESDAALAHRNLRSTLATSDGLASMPYNIAVARPLEQWPLVRGALAWLSVLCGYAQRKSLRTADLGPALLAGPCVGGHGDAAGLATMDALWRKRATVSVSAAEFSRQLGRYAPTFASAWANCQQELDAAAGAASAEIWAARFKTWLRTLGFPGQLHLDSHAFQVMEAFAGLLDRLAAQTPVVGQLRFSAAVSLLGRLARDTTFQPQRDPSARLDVLGFLEAEGGRWDAIWVLGLTDDVLPAAARPNPLIPLAALRLANAPRATPERELHWARTMYASLLTCAPDVWLSHAEYEGERELRPSPCIVDVALMHEEEGINVGQSVGRASALELIVDDQGPPLAAGVATRGGIGVIDTQARNPLWAFVKYRLGASELTDYAELADQNARGVFLHRAIELVWRLLPDQSALQALHDSGGTLALVDEAVRQAADECLQDYGATLRALEVERAMAVLQAWLQLELQRAPFRVRDVEQSYDWSHGPLQLSLRLDRIDELDDGRLAVIDYKSGNGNIDPRSNWMRSRPVGLQLPFYAAVLAGERPGVGALILAKLHARNIEVKGLADEDVGLPGLASLAHWPAFVDYSWDRLMAEWRSTIEDLAREYASGVARNQSLRPDDIQYCDVSPFLRLTEDYRRVD